MKTREFLKFYTAVILALLVSACATPQVPQFKYLAQQDGYHEELYVNRLGLKLFNRYWHPVKGDTPKAVVMIIHGTALHSGVYHELGENLAQQGYLVHGVDLQGWGQSESLGARGYIESYDDYSRDLMSLVNRHRMAYPDVPVFAIGESLGGAVAVYAYLKYNVGFDGIITSAIGYKPNPELIGIRAPELVNKLNQTMGEMWGNLFPSWPMINADIGIRAVIENDNLQDQLLNDPYVTHSWLPASYISALVDASDYIDENLERFDIPVLLLHGNDDTLVPLASSKEIYNRVKTSNKTLKVYQSPHAVLLEGDKDYAFEDISLWLSQQSSDNYVAKR